MTKKVISVIVALVLIFAAVYVIGSCVFIFSGGLFKTYPNTRDTAELMTEGERTGQSLSSDEDYWLYFDLDETTVVALDYDKDQNVASYFYSESEAMAAPYYVNPETSESDPNDPDTDEEPNRLYGNGFETRELSAGRYYFRLHVIQSGMFGRRVAAAMYMIVDDLPVLPTGSEQIVASNGKDVRLSNGYYTLDLTEERSDFTVDTIMPDHVTLYLDYYYGQNNSRNESLYFHNGKYNESSQTFTLPAGTTIVKVDARVDDEYGGTQPDAIVKFTAVKAAPGTAFDREVSALPELPLGRELTLSKMFDFKFDFAGDMMHGLNSMRIELTENSVLSVRVKNYPHSSSLSVSGYFNTETLNSVKRQSGSVIFSALEQNDDKVLSFELPAALNLIELRVNLALDYSEAVFAASTIEFNILPVGNE